MITDRRAGYSRRLFLVQPLAASMLAEMPLDSTFRAAVGTGMEWRGSHYRAAGGR
jgi:hypothetical protein